MYTEKVRYDYLLDLTSRMRGPRGGPVEPHGCIGTSCTLLATSLYPSLLKHSIVLASQQTREDV